MVERSDSDPVTPAPEADAIDGVDILLGVLTVLPTLFVLMFATTAMAETLRHRRARRRLGLGLVAAEAVIVAIVIALVFA